MEKCEFEAVIQDTLSLIEHRLREAQQEARQEGMREPAQSQPQNRESQFQTQKVKLPKLTLPEFDGTATEWPPFWDSFDSAVHSNPTLADVDKFHYLKSLVKGTAADTISGLTLTNENYKRALDLLRERFENKQIIISHSLLKLPSISSSTDLQSLRKLHDQTETAVRSLKSVNIEPST